ncbi:MAG: hypothetical protein ABR588_08830 [Sphingomicrobium sp.]|nr:hypothetical protein [Sphingomonadales bacterium]
MSLFLNGSDMPYNGNPAMQQMLLMSALRGQNSGMIPGQNGGQNSGMMPLGRPQTVTSEPVPVAPTNGPIKGADPADFGKPGNLPPVSAQQLSAATATIGNGPRSTPPGQQPVMADGSQPLMDFNTAASHQLYDNPQGLTANMPGIAAHRNGIDWKRLAGIIGPALMAAGGHPELGMQFIENQQKMRNEEAQRQFDLSKLSLQQSLPREVGHALIQKGSDGQYHELYSDPEPFESYAQAQGLKPGTPEYAAAVKSYRLGGWSDDAVANREGYAGVRFGYQGQLQDARLRSGERNTDVRANASINNNIRTTGVSAANNARTVGATTRGQDLRNATVQRGQTMLDNRVRGSAAYQGHGGHAGFGGGASAVAVGPNGHRIVVQNGRWVDAQTGQPVQ